MHAPKIRPFTLPQLATGYSGDLDGGEYLELLHFDRLVEPLQAREARLEECLISSLQLEQISNARLIQCELRQIDSPVMQAAGTYFNDVRVGYSRFGSADFADAEFDSVVFDNCKFGWLNLRGVNARDVQFRNCQFDELDLQGAKIQRMSFVDSRAGQLSSSQATLREVDFQGLDFGFVDGLEGLRGAQISTMQLSMLAEQMASYLGIKLAK